MYKVNNVDLIDLENKLEIEEKEIALPYEECFKIQNISFESHAPAYAKELVNKDDKVFME